MRKTLTAIEANEIAHHHEASALKKTKRYFCKRIKQLAKEGEFSSYFTISQYYWCWDALVDWFTESGFKTKLSVEEDRVYVYWNDLSILNKEKEK